jgi:acyl phosphate:glycerol-3-phosphate acyltransferase
MAALTAVLAAVAIGYFSGSLPWGLWLGRWFRGVDVRSMGSGNLGATNVYRALGPALGITTLVLDMLKGALPVWLAGALPFAAAFPGGAEWCRLAVGFSAIAGHVWTVFAGFRGGKGVATTAGVVLALSPIAFLVSAGVFVATVALTRYISLGSILGAVTFAATLAVLSPGGIASPTFMFGALVALLVVARHKQNIGRLLRGEERRFALRSGKPSNATGPEPAAKGRSAK